MPAQSFGRIFFGKRVKLWGRKGSVRQQARLGKPHVSFEGKTYFFLFKAIVSE